MVSLNIKDQETHDLIKELAALKGTTLTGAVKTAVREELTRAKAAQEKAEPKKGLAAWLEEISRETAPLMSDGRTSIEAIEDLYDPETGLPR